MSIFEQDKFTLKDFCTTFENISDEIISKIYKTYGKYTGSYAYIKYLLLKFPDIYFRL